MGCVTPAPVDQLQSAQVQSPIEVQSERFEVFDPESISAGRNNESVSRHHVGQWGFGKTAYGSIAMLCNEEQKGVHHFTIRIDECQGTKAFAIGIDQGRSQMNLAFHTTNSPTSYSIDSRGCKRSASHKAKEKKNVVNGFKLNSGTILEMEFDVEQRTLSFAVNGGRMKEMFKIPTSTIPYYLAVSLKNKGDKVTVTNYGFSGVHSQSEDMKHDDERIHFLEDQVFRLKSRCDELEDKVQRLEKEKVKLISDHKKILRVSCVKIKDERDRNKLLKAEIDILTANKTANAGDAPPSYDDL